MKKLMPVFRNTRWYFFIVGFLMLAAISLLIIFGEDFLFIPLSQYHPELLNIFFINYTFMGDGLFALALPVFYIFYLKKKQQGLLLATGFILSGVSVQLIKNSISESGFRIFFEQGQYLFFSDESVFTNFNSFPSGHTANAFMIATMFALSLRNRTWQMIVLIVAAILLAISRMYLAQDHLIDILGGVFIGTVSGVTSFYIVEKVKELLLLLKKIIVVPKHHPVIPENFLHI